MSPNISPATSWKLLRLARWLAVDVIIIVTAFCLAFAARALTAALDIASNAGFILAATIILLTSLYLNGVYRRIWSHTSGHGVIVIIRGVTFATLPNLLLDLALPVRPMPLSVLLMGTLLSLGGLVAVRYRSRLVGGVHWRWRAIWHHEFPTEQREQVLIIGAGESGQTTAHRLQHRLDDTHYRVVGFVDDEADKQGMYVENCPVLGTTAEIPALVEAYEIDLLVVAIHNISGANFRRILALCEQTSARVKVIPDMLAFFRARFSRGFLRDVLPEDLIGRTQVEWYPAIDMHLLSRRTILVTGAAGSIGSELARQLLQFQEPQKLILLDNNESALHDLLLDLQAQYPQTQFVAALIDITLEQQVNDLFMAQRPQVVFHAAAYKHVPMLERYPDEAVRVNIGGTLNVAEAAIAAGVERFVLISTDKAVNPVSVMGASKRVCELVIHAFAERSHHTLFTAVRFGNVLGSRGSVVPIFNRQIDMGGPVTVTHPEMTRYFMSIAEAANLVIHAAAMTQSGDIFVLRMGDGVRIVDLAERMIRMRGLRPQVDIPIKIVGMREGEKLHEELHSPHERLLTTQHPDISRVSAWMLNGYGDEFMTNVSSLVRSGVSPDNQALETLLTLCRIYDDMHHLEDQTAE